MSRLARPFLTALCLLTLVCVVNAQADASRQSNDVKKPAAGKDASIKSKADPEAERMLQERRSHAESLLISLAADAHKFSDETLKARTLARIADALWEVNHERGRAMFRAAWEAAVIADRESQQLQQEDIRQQQEKTGRGGYVLASPPEVRREVLRLATKHDRALGEEFLGKFGEHKEQEATEAKNTRTNPFGNADEAVGQRLNLARELLAAGDTERALQFADPVLAANNMWAIDFLSYLREKNPTAADRRYATILVNAAASPQSDANTVSLLSSYIFTPHQYVTFQGIGAGTSQMAPTIVPANVAPELRAAFFSAAASILLRPLAPPGQDQSTSGPDGEYLVIKRLLPLFEQYAPQEMTLALRAQLEVLFSVASNSARQRDDEWVRKGISLEKPAEDREASLLDEIDHAKTSAERDRLNLQLALVLAGKGDMRARDYVDKIEDSEMRHNARAYIDGSMAVQAVDKKDVDRAVEMARTGELTHLQRAWLLTQIAKLLVKSDREKALSLIDDATTEARRIEGSDADRPRAFFAVANALLAVDRAAVWDAVWEAIKASNSAENFGGEDGQLTFRIITKGMRSIYQNSVPDFDVTGIFEALAKDDYEKTVDFARGFTRDAPRASSTIAIARAVLEEKKK